MKAEESKKKIGLLKQLRDFAGGPLIGVLISMVTVPIVTRMVSPVEFGKSALFTLVQTFFSLIAFLGLDQAFVRYFNTKEYDKKNLLYNSILFPLILCCLFIIGIIIFEKHLSFWLFEQNEPLLMFLLCLFLPALLVNRFAFLIIRMNLRGKLYSLLSISTQIINFISLLILLYFFERSFRSIILATIISTLVNTFIAFMFTKDAWSLNKKYFDKTLLKKLFQFGAPLVPATALSWVLDSVDKIGLKQWGSYEQLGLYAAAFKIVALLTVLQTIFTTTWVPVAYKWYEDKENVVKFDFVRILVLAIMAITFAGIVVLRDIVLLFLGPAYRNTAIIFIYLLLIPVMYTISETTTLGIAFSGKTQFNLYVSIICVTCSVIGNFLLIPSYGARGAALSTGAAYLVFFWARTIFSRRLWYKFKLDKYFINVSALVVLVLMVEFNAQKYFEVIIMGLIILINGVFVKKYYIGLQGKS